MCDDGTVLVVDIDGGRIVRVDGGTTTVVATPGGGPNGMALGGDGAAYVANNGGFLWTEVNGVRIPIDHPTHTNEPPGFAGGWIERVDLGPARRPCSTTRATAGACGGRTTWRSTRSAACGSPTTARAASAASTAAACTTSRPAATRCDEVAFPLLGPNGVGLSPDGRRVYVAETHTGRLWAWDLAGPGEVRPAAGSLAVRHGGTLRGRHALLVRLVGRRGGRADRDRRHR